MCTCLTSRWHRMDKNLSSKQQIVKDVTQRLAEIDNLLAKLETKKKEDNGKMIIEIDKKIGKLKKEKKLRNYSA